MRQRNQGGPDQKKGEQLQGTASYAVSRTLPSRPLT
jgi:hypothetical protein